MRYPVVPPGQCRLSYKYCRLAEPLAVDKHFHYSHRGAEGRIRTDTGFTPPDFESGASTSFATPAVKALYTISRCYGWRKKCE